MKKTLLVVAGAIVAACSADAQNVSIPDGNFKAALLAHTPAIDTDNNREISVSEARAFTGTMVLLAKNISDLTGIEAFTALTGLACNDNQITTLDLTDNSALTQLECDNNLLTHINITQNTALTKLSCSRNQLADLDLSNNTALTKLLCERNLLTALDVSNNTDLTELFCSANQISNLDVRNNTALKALFCDRNLITDLNLAGISTISDLNCANNQIDTLDLANLQALFLLECSNNILSSLNLANGNNRALTYLYTQNNPDLDCIKVDDAAYATANWTGLDYITDPGVRFSENCANTTAVNSLPNSHTIGIYPNPATTHINFTHPTNVILTNAAGQTITYKKDVTTLSIADQPAGTYFLTVTTEHGGVPQHTKVVKK